jgi:hypothetical protein
VAEVIETKISTRFRIVGVEVVGLGAFLLFLFAIAILKGNIQDYDWDFAVVGSTMVMVGFEILQLVKMLPGASATQFDYLRSDGSAVIQHQQAGLESHHRWLEDYRQRAI